MTTGVLDRGDRVKGGGIAAIYTDNVIPDLLSWSREGERCALITLIGVDGNAPRAEGAQMAVSEGGRWVGYISGGCLEQAIALEAAEAIQLGKPRLLRYGKGSPYFDIRLPCGSGLDVFVQPMRDMQQVQAISDRLALREPFAVHIDLASGALKFEALVDSSVEFPQSRRDGDSFIKVYAPSLRCLVIGSSPIAAALAELASNAGFESELHAPDIEALRGLPDAVKLRPLLPRAPFKSDRWTAVVLAFHDHDQELPIFRELLRTPCFFMGAIGSRNAHAARKLALEEAGFPEEQIARIESPAGLVPGLKTAPFVALSILTQIVAKARELGMIS